MRRLTIIILLVFVGTYSFAGGYGVSLQSQKHLGMGHVGTGLYLDGSAIFFNPGALSQQQSRWEFTFGVNPLWAKAYYQNPETRTKTETENPLGTPVEFYMSYRISDKFVAGLGFYTPYGSGVKWPSGWEGRALITEIKLQSFFFQPTLSYQIRDWLSVGAGLVIANGTVDLQKDIPAISGGLKIEGSSEFAYGYNVGVYMKPTEKFSLGISYRSKIELKVEGGDAAFSVPQSLAGSRFFTPDTFSAKLPMISSVNIGMAYMPNEKWTVAADLNFNNWSEYEQLLIEFDQNKTLNNPQLRNYENTITARLGAQYLIDEVFTARAGVYFDPTPVRDNYFTPETPSMNNIGYTLGGSAQLSERLQLDVSLLIIQGLERRSGYEADNFIGDFRTFAISPGIGISYKF